MRLLSLLIGCLLMLNSFGQKQIHGYVKSDGQGIAKVQVSAGNNIALTNEKGFYKLAINEDEKFVQISTPSGFAVERKGTIPLFYKQILKEQECYNFELIKNSIDDYKHKFIVQTDVQVANENDLAIYKNTLVKDIKNTISTGRNEHWFGIDLGDLVGDDAKLFPKYEQAMHEIDLPVYRLIGNHDMTYWGRSHETSEKHFNDNFGPTRYSFNKGEIHYVVINNNFFVGRDYFYMGYIDEKTFQWLEKDLSQIPKGRTVFLMMHIPSRIQAEKPSFAYNYSLLGGTTVNADALYNLFKDYKVHILSGHTHQNYNIIHHESLMEHNIAAASGSWWEFDVCTDGTPRGYRVFEVDGEHISWYYKSQEFDKQYQSRSYIDSLGYLITNVWNYDSNWKIKWYENDVLMGDMEQFEGNDLYVVDLFKTKNNIRYNWISSTATKHLFKGKVINNNARISVKVTDRFGNIYEEIVKK